MFPKCFNDKLILKRHVKVVHTKCLNMNKPVYFRKRIITVSHGMVNCLSIAKFSSKLVSQNIMKSP